MHLLQKTIDNVFIEIGNLEIYWYAILILSGALLAYFLALREGKRIGVDGSFLETLVLFGIPIAIVGARIYYVIFEWDHFRNNLSSIFNIRGGGLAIYGAIIAGLIWAFWLTRRYNVDLLRVIDLAAVGFLLAQAIGRWGNFMNQEAYGGVVSRDFLERLLIPKFVIDQMYINGNYHHPTFLYESVWNTLGFGLMLGLRRTKKLYVGDLGLVYLMWYGLGRAYIEGMRTDSLYLGSIRISQLLSILMVIGGAVVFILRHVKKWRPQYYYELLEENGADPKEIL